MSGDARQELTWDEGVPVSTRFDDPYYSRADGLAESRFVFLGGNDLPARWAGGCDFHIAELGFGTGLNLCAALVEWRRAGIEGHLHFTSFERFPLSADEINRALSVWPEINHERDEILALYDPRGGGFDLKGATLELITGDARETVPGWGGRADAWFLDGFAPSRNPELWEPALIQSVAEHAAPGCTFATYSAAGAVRRGLQAAGLDVTRSPGFGTKREMLIAVKPPRP